jgi:hypothetical protein
MFRFSISLALLLTALFSLAVVAVRVQPYDDRELRALLLPEDCPLPCFMGIRPGRTRVETALDILRRHQWVAVESIDYHPGISVEWLWNGQQPALIDPGLSARLVFNANATLIEQVWVGMRLQAGQIHLLLGKPPFFTVGISQLKRFQPRLTVNEYYASEYFYTHTETTCPLHFANYMRLPVQQLTFFNERVSGGDLFARLPVFSALNPTDYRVC